ncbi:hypothetical protein GOBAR_AA34616 [Gossypium barbadense]|uniref:Uncharacterized protein n=1 Tax=Gossypium barbadense TaxID=3634 RepID=A0A2P5W4P1_GOSBA|nr:hypothetical protein GOBAR_AA34616 [Gossypium barbadense]
MLSKFISVSETHFQNTKTALKNQQALIQGLETQIGQLSKLISEQPQGSLPSNTESNPREHLNAISTQNKEGFIEPELELQQDNAMNKEPLRNKTTETVHYYRVANKDTHEERRLQIEELDEWRAHKPGTHDKLKLPQNKPDTSPNQLKVGDKVLLVAADPHIVTTIPNEEIPLTILSIFPFGTVEVSHSKFGTFKPWVNLIGDHDGNGKLQACQGQGSILFLRHGRETRPCRLAVYNNTRVCYHNTRVWKKRTKLDTAMGHGRVRHTPKTHGLRIAAGQDLNRESRKTWAHPQSTRAWP